MRVVVVVRRHHQRTTRTKKTIIIVRTPRGHAGKIAGGGLVVGWSEDEGATELHATKPLLRGDGWLGSVLNHKAALAFVPPLLLLGHGLVDLEPALNGRLLLLLGLARSIFWQFTQ